MDSSIFSLELMPVIASSSAMRSIETLVNHLALSSVPVLFTGEKGTGRCFLAQYMYRIGEKQKAFVRLVSKDTNPADLARVLSIKPGMIFFDEIADADSEMQKCILDLLSVPENSENYCRVCCSTSENLEEKAASGQFSSELYYRLAVLPVRVPALRERLADIPQLAQNILSVHSRRYNKNFKSFSDEALEMLKNAYWPLNVVELDSCIERACAIAVPPVIEKHDLRLNILSVSDIFLVGDKSLKTAVDSFKKQYITQILASVRWNQTEAAKVLDIQRTYLSRLIKELHIK